MGVKKQIRGHRDPLLKEVVAGLEETLSSLHEEKAHGVRGAGERTFSRGDPLLRESERYHQMEHDNHDEKILALHFKRDRHYSLFDPNYEALFDPILEEYVMPAAVLTKPSGSFRTSHGQLPLLPAVLKRTKDNSLLSPQAELTSDPVLHEYVVPDTSMLELKAFRDDVMNKRHLFEEMKMRRDHNLESYELLCDPLVASYRTSELLAPQTPVPPETRGEKKRFPAVSSKFRKNNGGDDLLKATAEHDKLVATAE
ncbi:hypothetical protein ACHAWF_015525 [Thalassiosira exigua]